MDDKYKNTRRPTNGRQPVNGGAETGHHDGYQRGREMDPAQYVGYRTGNQGGSRASGYDQTGYEGTASRYGAAYPASAGYQPDGYVYSNYGGAGYAGSGYDATGYGAGHYGSEGYGSSTDGSTVYGSGGQASVGYGSDSYESEGYGASTYGSPTNGPRGYDSGDHDMSGYGMTGYDTSGYDVSAYDYEATGHGKIRPNANAYDTLDYGTGSHSQSGDNWAGPHLTGQSDPTMFAYDLPGYSNRIIAQKEKDPQNKETGHRATGTGAVASHQVSARSSHGTRSNGHASAVPAEKTGTSKSTARPQRQPSSDKTAKSDGASPAQAAKSASTGQRSQHKGSIFSSLMNSFLEDDDKPTEDGRSTDKTGAARLQQGREHTAKKSANNAPATKRLSRDGGLLTGLAGLVGHDDKAAAEPTSGRTSTIKTQAEGRAPASKATLGKGKPGAKTGGSRGAGGAGGSGGSGGSGGTRGSGSGRDRGRRRKRLTSGQIAIRVMTAMIVFLLVILIGIWGVWRYVIGGARTGVTQSFAKPSFVETENVQPVGQSPAQNTASTDPTQPTQFRDGKIINVLLMGMDLRQEGEEYGRSDTMMMVTIDQINNVIKLTSFQRDMLVYAKGYPEPMKLNAVSKLGPFKLMETLNDTFHLDIKDYVMFDIAGAEDVINAVGGVEVDIPANYEVQKYLNRLIEEQNSRLHGWDEEGRKHWSEYIWEYGPQILNGRQAIAYSRMRELDSDFCRMERQQEIFGKVFDKAMNSGPGTILNVLRTGLSHVTTNMSEVELTEMGLELLPKLRKDVIHFQVPIQGYYWMDGRGPWVIRANFNLITPILHKYVYGDNIGKFKSVPLVPYTPLGKSSEEFLPDSVLSQGTADVPFVGPNGDPGGQMLDGNTMDTTTGLEFLNGGTPAADAEPGQAYQSQADKEVAQPGQAVPGLSNQTVPQTQPGQPGQPAQPQTQPGKVTTQPGQQAVPGLIPANAEQPAPAPAQGQSSKVTGITLQSAA